MKWILSLLLSASYANLLVLFVLQHLFPVMLVLPALAVLTLTGLWPVHRLVRAAARYSDRLSVRNRTGFWLLLGIVGLAFYVFGPIAVPSNVALNAAGFPMLLEQVTQVLTVALVGGSSFGALIILLTGTVQPVMPRFIAVTAFFFVYLMIGLLIYDDYGVSVDEAAQRQHGLISTNFVLQQIAPDRAQELFGSNMVKLHRYENKYYPVAFHIPLTVIEQLNGLEQDMRSVWLYRHFAVFLFYFGGAAAFYRLIYDKYGRWTLGLLGALLLVMTPNIFGQSFNNIKDPVFLAAFAMTLYTGFRCWRRKTLPDALLFATVAAFASNIRIVAVFIVAFALVLMLIDLFAARTQGQPRRITVLSRMLVLVVVFTVLHVVMYPASWSNPINFSVDALLHFSNYEIWGGAVPYMGMNIDATRPPWHYLPVWFTITIPLTYQALFVVGSIAILREIERKHVRLIFDERREEVGFLAMFVLPVIALILMRSTLYSDWRQFYFLYAPYLMVVMFGVNVLADAFVRLPYVSLARRILLVGMVAAVLYQGYLLGWMIINHPHQNVFRVTPMVELLGGRRAYDHDMMRLSLRQGLEYIAWQDSRDAIIVCVNNAAYGGYLEILPREDRQRIQLVHDCAGDKRDFDYLFDIYRDPFASLEAWGIADNTEPLHLIRIDDLPILAVYKVR
jgi:hypothetical protein